MNNTALKLTTPSMEETIRQNMLLTVEAAKSLKVVDADTYQDAATKLKLISERKKQVQDYWKAPKESAAKAHKDICAKEKDMLNPLTEAESSLKQSMGAYNLQVEAKRRAEAAEAERKKQEERERLLAEAVSAEETGDTVAAETALIMAEMVEDMKAMPVTAAVQKTEGISVRKTWKARIIDDSKVPTHFGGVCIRPVDTSALNNLARMTKGTAEITGVEFYEDANFAVR